jgi:hypothetical protein
VSMTAGVAQHNKKMFQLNKAAALANAVINTAQGISQTLASYPMPVAGILAAVHAAAGLAQIAAIQKQQFNGGGSGSAPSNATAVPTPTTPAGGGSGGGEGRGGVLRVQGMSADTIMNGASAAAIAQKLLDYQKDGGKVVFEQ